MDGQLKTLPKRLAPAQDHFQKIMVRVRVRVRVRVLGSSFLSILFR